jgi:threonine/homoserine/homoserine lactone efflux protein
MLISNNEKLIEVAKTAIRKYFIIDLLSLVSPEKGSLALQSFILGATLAGMAMIWIGMLVYVIGRFRTSFASRPKFLSIANKLSAIVFIGLAIRILFQNKI